jgi:hypothetical protein
MPLFEQCQRNRLGQGGHLKVRIGSDEVDPVAEGFRCSGEAEPHSTRQDLREAVEADHAADFAIRFAFKREVRSRLWFGPVVEVEVRIVFEEQEIVLLR